MWYRVVAVVARIMNRTWHILVLVAGLLGAGLFLWLASSPGRSTATAQVLSKENPFPEGLAAGTEVPPRVAETEGTVTRQALAGPSTPESVPPGAVVTLVLRNAETGTPIEGASVCLSETGSGEIVENRSSGVAGECLTTGPEGRVQFRVPPRVDLTLFAMGPGEEGEFESSSISVDPLEPAEARMLRVELNPARRSFDYFRVLDQETEQPIEGARLMSAEGPRDSAGGTHLFGAVEEWEREGEVAAVSDGEGFFRLPYLSTRTRAYGLHAPGYGPCLLAPRGESPVPDRPTTVRLEHSASLTGVIEVGQAEGSAEVTVTLQASGFSLIDLESSSWGVGVSDRCWSAMVSPGGVYRVDGLPPNVDLQLEIHVGGQTVLHDGELIRLVPGEERRFDWSEGAGSVVSGRLLVASGPSAGRTLWLVGARRALPNGMITGFDEPAYETETEETGVFRFEDVAPGFYFVGERPSGGTLSQSIAVLVQAPTSDDIVLDRTKQWTIEGKVVFRGESANHVEVDAVREDVWGLVRAETDDAGAFHLSLPVEGDWHLSTLQTMWGPQTVLVVGPGDLSVPTGSGDVRLEMVAAAHLGARAEDESGQAVRTRWVLLPRSPGATSLAFYDYTTQLDYRALRPGRYAVYAYSPDGRAAVSREVNLSAGEELTDLVVVLHRAARVRVKDTRTSPSRVTLSLRENGVLAADLYLFDAKSRTFFVPPGLYQFEVREALSSRLISTRDLRLVAGEESTVEVGDDGI